MILYHGTSIRNLDSILSNGLMTNTDECNWAEYKEHKETKKMVYLTSRFPIWFAANSCWDGSSGLILKLDVDVNNLYPDIDYFITRNKIINKQKFGVAEALFDNFNFDKFKNFEDGLISYKSEAMNSVKMVGLCAHLGNISKESVFAYTAIDFKARKSMLDLVLVEKEKDCVENFFGEEKFKKMELSTLGLRFEKIRENT